MRTRPSLRTVIRSVGVGMPDWDEKKGQFQPRLLGRADRLDDDRLQSPWGLPEGVAAEGQLAAVRCAAGVRPVRPRAGRIDTSLSWRLTTGSARPIDQELSHRRSLDRVRA